MTDSWYYIHAGETRGPVSAAEVGGLLKRAQIDAVTLIARAGWTDWKPAGEVPEIMALIARVDPPERRTPEPEIKPIYQDTRTVDPLAEITAVRTGITRAPVAGLRHHFRGSVLGGILLIAAMIAGFEVKWIARKDALEASQMPRGEQIAERCNNAVKDGFTLPREIRGLAAKDWARMEPEDLNRKEHLLDTSWNQYNEGKGLVSTVDGYVRQGATIPPEIVRMTANDWGLLANEDFARRKEELNTTWRQFQKSKQTK
jgi:hypothetical protein